MCVTKGTREREGGSERGKGGGGGGVGEGEWGRERERGENLQKFRSFLLPAVAAKFECREQENFKFFFKQQALLFPALLKSQYRWYLQRFYKALKITALFKNAANTSVKALVFAALLKNAQALQIPAHRVFPQRWYLQCLHS